MYRSMEGYRPEIDGLRAIAVLAVLIFHAQLSIAEQGLSGGYLGVDVFFVISGYLITRLILRQQQAATFSFVRFLERRARRILPALFLVVGVTTAAGFVLLPRASFAQLLDSVVSVALFHSNLYFWSEAGYFGAADNAPLLHTWSLAVEEQFYLFYPWIFYVARREKGQWAVWIISALGISSFAVAQYASTYHPVASFYFLPSRVWELLAGSGIALWEVRRGKFFPARSDALLTCLGMGLLAYSMCTMNEKSQHPGVVTLLPVTGTCLVIRYASSAHVYGRALASRPLVHLGLISYSLYLWHQPLLTLARRLYGRALPQGHLVGLLLLSGLMAELTFRWVETPARRGYRARSFAVLFASGFASILMAMLSAGVARLYPNDEAEALAELGLSAPSRNSSYTSKPGTYRGREHSWVVLGDCHAAVLTAALKKRLPSEGATLRTYARNGCPFIPGFNYRHARMKLYGCDEQNARILGELQRLPPHTVVVTYRASLYLHAAPFDNGEGGVEWGNQLQFESSTSEVRSLEQGMKDALLDLLRAGHRVILIYPLPELGWDPVEVVLAEGEKVRDATASVSHAAFMARNRQAYRVYDEVGELGNLVRVYPERLFCDTTVPGRCVALHDRKLLYYDNNHLSEEGADLLVAYLIEQVGAH